MKMYHTPKLGTSFTCRFRRMVPLEECSWVLRNLFETEVSGNLLFLSSFYHEWEAIIKVHLLCHDLM